MFANPVKEAAALDRYAQQFNDDDRTKTWQRTAFQLTKPIPEDMLFPIQKQPFGDVMVSCPNDYSVWQPMLNEELERQVSSIQKADLILLRELDRVCTLLGIKYFVCGGTMLGYVRHGGFIPWDDDVDVAMLRSDYNRFISEAGAVLDKRVFLQTRDTDPNIPYLFSKIRLNDTEYVTEYNEFRDFHKGICLDIFPFDFLPDEPKKCQDFIQEVIGLSKQHNGTANHQYAIEQSDIVPRNEREANYLKTQKEKLDMYWAQDLRISQQAYIEAATRYNADAEKNELTIVASFIPSFTYIDLNDLFPLQRGMFEDVEVSLPRRPEVFLKMQYGDFMKLPPKHQQIAHRLVRWSTWEAHGGKEQESAT